MQLLPALLVFLFSTQHTFYPEAHGRMDGTIVVQDGRLTMYGTQIDTLWSHEAFIKAMGEPESYHDDDKRVEVYDSRGIAVWKENDDYTQVTEFTVSFSLDDDQFTTDQFKFYSGSIIVEGISIGPNTTIGDLKQKLPQYNWSTTVGDWYKGVYKNIFIYTKFDASQQHMVWIDFGLDDENSWDED